jgi:hypothetical protein
MLNPRQYSDSPRAVPGGGADRSSCRSRSLPCLPALARVAMFRRCMLSPKQMPPRSAPCSNRTASSPPPLNCADVPRHHRQRAGPGTGSHHRWLGAAARDPASGDATASHPESLAASRFDGSAWQRDDPRPDQFHSFRWAREAIVVRSRGNSQQRTYR